MGSKNKIIEINAPDLSPVDLTQIKGPNGEKILWELAATLDASPLLFALTGKSRKESEPILRYEAHTRTWWTGRYIGEIRRGDTILRITPRFGMPALQRWLSRIYGVQSAETKGAYTGGRIWVWELLAVIWAQQLMCSSQHGLPYNRVAETYVGTAARGKMLIRETALQRGRNNIVSQNRVRHLDNQIGSILLAAFAVLHQQLGRPKDNRSWLSERGVQIIKQLQAEASPRQTRTTAGYYHSIRYTPITESYRGIVDLSLAILRCQPISSSLAGDHNVQGVLFDMAEIWETYLFHLLRTGIHGSRVIHTGRGEPPAHLLHSHEGSPQFGLIPDLLICHPEDNRCLVILDAKYKSTTTRPDVPYGIHREDLYQMTAYLSTFGGVDCAEGVLVYPFSSTRTGRVTDLQRQNPWRMPAYDSRHISFLGVEVLDAEESDRGYTPPELSFLSEVRNIVARSRP